MLLSVLNKNFKITVDGCFVGVSGLYRAVGMRNTEELCRRAFNCKDDIFKPKRLTNGHIILFISK